MTTYVVVQNGVVTEVFKPLTNAQGYEIPLSDRFTPQFVKALIVSLNDSVSVGWTYTNGVFTAPAVVTAAMLLTEAIENKIDELSLACANAILAGFTSKALGSPYLYPAKGTDQTNLASSVLSAIIAQWGAGTWKSAETYAVGDTILANGIIYRCATAGITGKVIPTLPTEMGITVLDGMVQWDIWATPFWCATPAGVWGWEAHSSPEIQRVGQDAKQAILTNMVKNATLSTQALSCTTLAQVAAIAWDSNNQLVSS